MNLLASVLAATATPLAVTATPTAPGVPPGGAAPGWFSAFSSPLVLIGGLFLLSTVLFGGNKAKRSDEKARTEMLKNLKRGDRIQSIGGILGAVVRVEADRVEVKIDESSNVKVWFARSAISKVVDADKAEK